MQPRQVPKPGQSQNQRGFNLVEVIIASVILIVSLISAVQISGRSTVIGVLTSQRYEREAAIDADLARIQRLNDRYTCVSNTCEPLPDDQGNMDKFKYFPDPLNGADANGDGIADSQETALYNFQNRCTYQNNLDLVTPLKNILDRLSKPNGVERVITIDSPAIAHRYTITYTDTTSSEVLRQVTLTPSAVAWCPRV